MPVPGVWVPWQPRPTGTQLPPCEAHVAGPGPGPPATQHICVGSEHVFGLGVIDPQPRLEGTQLPPLGVHVSGGGVTTVQQESDAHSVGSDSSDSLARQPPVARQVPTLLLTFPRQTLPAVGIQQTRPTVHAESVSEIPVQLPPLLHTPDRLVMSPVQKHPGPVQPDGVAAQELPFQLEPVAHTPCEDEV